MEKKANGKSILALSFEIFAPKIFFTDIVKFHYGLSMESETNKKSSLALSFKILALGHSQIFKKKFFCWKYPNYQILDLKKIFQQKKFFIGLSQISLWAVHGVEDQ
jgi:hypothetical protein